MGEPAVLTLVRVVSHEASMSLHTMINDQVFQSLYGSHTGS